LLLERHRCDEPDALYELAYRNDELGDLMTGVLGALMTGVLGALLRDALDVRFALAQTLLRESLAYHPC
jgi:hypothetical protein